MESDIPKSQRIGHQLQHSGKCKRIERNLSATRQHHKSKKREHCCRTQHTRWHTHKGCVSPYCYHGKHLTQHTHATVNEYQRQQTVYHTKMQTRKGKYMRRTRSGIRLTQLSCQPTAVAHCHCSHNSISRLRHIVHLIIRQQPVASRTHPDKHTLHYAKPAHTHSASLPTATINICTRHNAMHTLITHIVEMPSLLSLTIDYGIQPRHNPHTIAHSQPLLIANDTILLKESAYTLSGKSPLSHSQHTPYSTLPYNWPFRNNSVIHLRTSIKRHIQPLLHPTYIPHTYHKHIEHQQQCGQLLSIRLLIRHNSGAHQCHKYPEHHSYRNMYIHKVANHNAGNQHYGNA